MQIQNKCVYLYQQKRNNMTTKEAKNKVLSMIPTDLGKSFADVKKELVANCDKNGYGCSDHIEVKQNGYSLFYTENANFMGGVNNGGGKGFFARLYFVGLCKDVKLC